MPTLHQPESNVQTLDALRALWQGLRDPRSIAAVSVPTAVAIFAAAVLVVTLADTAAVFAEASSVSLSKESVQLTTIVPGSETGSSTTAVPAKAFTAAFGGALILTTVSYAAMAGLLWLLMRFLTNERVGYAMALGAVSATAGIEVVQTSLTTGLHLLTGSVRYGLHLGVVVSPAEHPYLFLWLQRLDVLTAWQYIAAAMVLSVWSGVHYRYGIVVGGLVFAVVQAVFGLLSLISWLAPHVANMP